MEILLRQFFCLSLCTYDVCRGYRVSVYTFCSLLLSFCFSSIFCMFYDDTRTMVLVFISKCFLSYEKSHAAAVVVMCPEKQ